MNKMEVESASCSINTSQRPSKHAKWKMKKKIKKIGHLKFDILKY